MAVTLPIVGGSSGVWGSILNDAITDIDNRLVTATGTNSAQDTDITDLKSRLTALETAPPARGMLIITTSGTRPPMTQGQICLETDTGYLYYVHTAGGALTRIPWPGSHIAGIRQTTAQNTTTGTATALTMDTRDFDRLGGWAGTSRYTAFVKGLYEFTGAVSFATNTTGYRACYWAVNGAGRPASRVQIPPAPTGASTVIAARPMTVSLNVGDYVELMAHQNSGATLSTDVTTGTMYQPSVLIKFLGYYGN